MQDASSDVENTESEESGLAYDEAVQSIANRVDEFQRVNVGERLIGLEPGGHAEFMDQDGRVVRVLRREDGSFELVDETVDS